ncbi:MAG TPA: hypothetical protein V6D27_09610, partial [Vampirovibrionales bacterium]
KPTLILWGVQDPWLPLTQGETFAGLIKNAELVKLAEAGHYPQEHWSEEVTQALIPFFRRMEV